MNDIRNGNGRFQRQTPLATDDRRRFTRTMTPPPPGGRDSHGSSSSSSRGQFEGQPSATRVPWSRWYWSGPSNVKLCFVLTCGGQRDWLESVFYKSFENRILCVTPPLDEAAVSRCLLLLYPDVGDVSDDRQRADRTHQSENSSAQQRLCYHHVFGCSVVFSVSLTYGVS